MIRQIRHLLYEEGFTIGGARQRLTGDHEEESGGTAITNTALEEIVKELDDLIELLK